MKVYPLRAFCCICVYTCKYLFLYQNLPSFKAITQPCHYCIFILNFADEFSALNYIGIFVINLYFHDFYIIYIFIQQMLYSRYFILTS